MSSEMTFSGSNCTICCQNFDRSVNDQDGNISTIISQTIYKIFGILQDHFGFESLDLDCCPNCSSLIVNIHKILEKLDEVKLQLEEIIIKNTAAGDYDEQNSAEIARNEIIKRIKPCINPMAVKIKLEDNEDLNEDLNEVLDVLIDPDWNNLSVEDYFDKTHEKSQDNEVVLGLGLEQSNSYHFEAENLKTPVLRITKLPQSLVNQLTQKNVHLQTIQNEILLLNNDQDIKSYKKKALNRSKLSVSSNFSCEICGAVIKNKFSLKLHMASAHGIGQSKYTCHICNRAMSNGSALRRHLKSHKMREKGQNQNSEKDKPFKCTKKNCTKAFSDKYALRIHITSKHENAFICSFCDRKMCTLAALKTHIKERHKSDEEMKFPCIYCTLRFCDEGRLNIHLKLHEKKMQTDGQTYKCEICEKDLTSLEELRIHMKSHTDDLQNQTKDVKSAKVKKFACTKCDKSYNWKKNLHGHMVDKHGDRSLFKCQICKKQLNTMYSIKQHTRNKHGVEWVQAKKERNFKCPHDNCEYKFYSEDTLNMHIEKTHIEPATITFCCELCGKFLKSEFALKCHMKVHNEDFSDFCEFCGKGFVSSGRLRLHLVSHEKKALNPNFSCTICNEEFLDEDSLWSHKLIHKRLYVTENDPSHIEESKKQDSSSDFLCGICGAVIKRKFSLKLHMASAHGIGHSKFTCHICNRVMSNGSALSRHLKSHKMREKGQNQNSEKDKPFKCTKENCSKAFGDQHSLRIHIASRHENAFNCKFCDKNMSSLYALKNHIKDRHKSDEELKFPCTYCTRRFFDESRLNVHLKLHEKKIKMTGKTYKCEVCEKELTSLGGLRIHMRTHTGEKPFKCSYCDRRFHVKQLMINHEACHSDERNFHCTVCNKSFKLIRYLSRHKLNSPGCRLKE